MQYKCNTAEQSDIFFVFLLPIITNFLKNILPQSHPFTCAASQIIGDLLCKLNNVYFSFINKLDIIDTKNDYF